MAEQEADLKAAEQEISAELLRIHEESYGVGATKVVTHVLDELVVVVIDVELTPAERTLLDAGHADAVKRTRESFQEVIGPTFQATVEHATGRRVNAFVSHLNVEPLFSVELFRLSPSPTSSELP